jgi:hypothetical protein
MDFIMVNMDEFTSVWFGRTLWVARILELVPVDANVDEAEEYGPQGASACRSAPGGIFSSSTMIVMMMAMTPSLKASSLPLPIDLF